MGRVPSGLLLFIHVGDSEGAGEVEILERGTFGVFGLGFACNSLPEVADKPEQWGHLPPLAALSVSGACIFCGMRET